jgi:ribose 1,5-bisphosphokinase
VNTGGQGAGAGRGTLVLVVGPSGVGKDSLIGYAKARVAGEKFVFPRRLITRPLDTAEDHEPILEAAFEVDAATGKFALHWRAHGLGYGVPASIADDLAAGRHVVANVSRAVLGDARRRFPPILTVSVTASRDIVAARLMSRGREAGEGIDERLARGGEYEVSGPGVIVLDNSGALELAGEMLVGVLRELLIPW